MQKQIHQISTLAESNLATALLFIQDDKVLLFKRGKTGFADGHYALPGGKCDYGESVITSGLREAYEEVGVTLSENQVEFGHVVHVMQTTKQGIKNWIIFFLVVRTWHSELFNKEPHKHDDMLWVPLDNLPHPMVASHHTGISAWRQKKLYSVLQTYS